MRHSGSPAPDRRRRASGPPVALDARILEPPFSRGRRVRDPAGGIELERGGLLLVTPSSPELDWTGLRREIGTLRRRIPTASLVLRVPDGWVVESVHLIRRAGELHVRGVVVGECDLVETLRPVLTNPTDLSSEIREWLTIRGVPVPGSAWDLLEPIIRASRHHRELRNVTKLLDVGARTVRARFRKAGLPSPGRWLQVARALRAALEVQGEPDRPLLTIAVERGYSDHSSLSRQILRLFGLRPRRIRETLGWEWLVDRWLRRSGTVV